MREKLKPGNLNPEALLVTLYLLASPILEVYCLATGANVLNFGSRGLRGLYIYGFAAPAVGYLMWRTHDRARFSLYVFLTIDIWRAIRIWSPPAAILNTSLLLYMQTTRMRSIYPKLEKDEIIERLKGRRKKFRNVYKKVHDKHVHTEEENH